MKQIGITVYGCERDEAAVFTASSPRFGVVPAMTGAAVSEANAMLASGNRCVSVGHKNEVPASTLHALKDAGVQYITTRSVGLNHIDLRAANNMGIAVGNVAYSPGSVADYAVMLMLMAIRNAKSIVSCTEAHDFRLDNTRGKELRDMTVGVLGTGHIGKAVIERLQGFGCRVLAHGRTRDAATEHVSFAELLKESDILTIHVPLNTGTYHMIGHDEIHAMKQGAFLVNTARGGVVDTTALITALENGRLGGAALDVLEGEEGLFYFDYAQRPVDNQFLLALQKMPNVLITPHAAYYTGRALQDTVENTLLNCLKFERNKR